MQNIYNKKQLKKKKKHVKIKKKIPLKDRKNIIKQMFSFKKTPFLLYTVFYYLYFIHHHSTILFVYKYYCKKITRFYHENYKIRINQ